MMLIVGLKHGSPGWLCDLSSNDSVGDGVYLGSIDITTEWLMRVGDNSEGNEADA